MNNENIKLALLNTIQTQIDNIFTYSTEKLNFIYHIL